MSFLRARNLLGALLAVVLLVLSGCSQVIGELKAARKPHAESLHEQLSAAIHRASFTHAIRSVREGTREIDTLFVSVPLDSLKRQTVTLHEMLFSVARLCARPEFANLSIEIELNAKDEKDRAYLSSVVMPIVAEASNVTVVPQREPNTDVVITIVNDLMKRGMPAR